MPGTLEGSRRMKTRRVKSIKDELLKKSREAILAAVQIYNNPQITFKAETFITLSIIAWTYLLHSYYRSKQIDYKYYKVKGKRKYYDRTNNGSKKCWGLEYCMNREQCPLDGATRNNLKFLIGIRHEIEHQMTNCIDEFLSAKLQACAINYDHYLCQLFGKKYSVARELALTIQFSAISPEQEDMLLDNERLANSVRNFICTFENDLTESDIKDPRYAYRILYVPINANRKGQADRMVEFVKPNSELSGAIERVLLKETEKNKYRPSEIVKIMQQEGFVNFKIHKHSELWQSLQAKELNKRFGVEVSRMWYWYDSWLEKVREHCSANRERYQ